MSPPNSVRIRGNNEGKKEGREGGEREGKTEGIKLYYEYYNTNSIIIISQFQLLFNYLILSISNDFVIL